MTSARRTSCAEERLPLHSSLNIRDECNPLKEQDFEAPRSQASDSRLQRLLDGVAGQERLAMLQFYQLTSPRLMAVILRILGDEPDANDVLQELYVKIWQQAEDIATRRSVWAWLTVMARNAALDVHRARRRSLVETRDALPEMAAPVVEAFDTGVERCLSSLNEKARESILLSYLYGYSHHELADRLQRPLGTIKAWIRRGLQELKQCLEA